MVTAVTRAAWIPSTARVLSDGVPCQRTFSVNGGAAARGAASMAGAAAAGGAPVRPPGGASGWPQWGQVAASRDTGPPHSGHAPRAILRRYHAAGRPTGCRGRGPFGFTILPRPGDRTGARAGRMVPRGRAAKLAIDIAF